MLSSLLISDRSNSVSQTVVIKQLHLSSQVHKKQIITSILLIILINTFFTIHQPFFLLFQSSKPTFFTIASTTDSYHSTPTELPSRFLLTSLAHRFFCLSSSLHLFSFEHLQQIKLAAQCMYQTCDPFTFRNNNTNHIEGRTHSNWTQFATSAKWLNMTPFGIPVVPLEYGSSAICWRGSKLTSSGHWEPSSASNEENGTQPGSSP